jgi:hypothetical protein
MCNYLFRSLRCFYFVLFAISAWVVTASTNVYAVKPNEAASRSAVPALALLYQDVARELLRGGTYIYFVPFETIGDDQKDKTDWWKHCALSRALSPEGMRQAQYVNRAIKRLGLRLAYAGTSQLCVALTTASFVSSGIPIQILPTPDLDPVELQRLSTSNDELIKVRLLSHFQTGQPDTIKIISSFPFSKDIAPHPVIGDLQSGDSAIFRSNNLGEPELIARLTWSQWDEMSTYILAAAMSEQRKKRRDRKPK